MNRGAFFLIVAGLSVLLVYGIVREAPSVAAAPAAEISR